MPVELILEIAACLEPPDLKRLCLVCETVTPVAQDVLYRSVAFVHSYKPFNLLFFLRAILERPDLANKVHSLTVLTENATIPGYNPVTCIFYLGTRGTLDVAASCKIGKRAKVTQINSTNHCRITGVVLDHLPSLRRLDLTSMELILNKPTLDPLQNLLGPCNPVPTRLWMRTLAELTIPFRHAGILLHLPAIEKLTLTHMEVETHSRNIEGLPPLHLPDLKRLSMQMEYTYDLVRLSEKLECPKLEHLDLYIHARSPSIRNGDFLLVLYSQFVEAAALHSSMIRNLSIRLDLRPTELKRVVHWPVSTLGKLTGLRHLTVPLSALLGNTPTKFQQNISEDPDDGNLDDVLPRMLEHLWPHTAMELEGDLEENEEKYLGYTFARVLESLPPSLEVLELQILDMRIASFLRSFIGGREGPWISNLTQIVLRDPMTCNWAPLEAQMDDLRKGLYAVNIELTVVV
jgi:hypothetical protein